MLGMMTHGNFRKRTKHQLAVTTILFLLSMSLSKVNKWDSAQLMSTSVAQLARHGTFRTSSFWATFGPKLTPTKGCQRCANCTFRLRQLQWCPLEAAAWSASRLATVAQAQIAGDRAIQKTSFSVVNWIVLFDDRVACPSQARKHDIFASPPSRWDLTRHVAVDTRAN